MPRHPFEDTTARVRQWALLTGDDFVQMDRKKTVVLVACSPLEVHGPHLPVLTDYHEAECLSLRAAELLCERFEDIAFVALPPIYVAADVVPQPGSLKFRTSTIQHVLTDLGRSLAAQGFEHIWVSSFHGGPRHFVSIEAACDKVNRRHGVKMVSAFSLLINLLTGGNSELSGLLGGPEASGIPAEALEGDHHAGAIETSLMLHMLGPHVAESWRALPRLTLNQKLQRQGLDPVDKGRPTLPSLMRGFRHKLKYYEDDSYTGTPSLASPEAGQKMLEILASATADALGELWTGQRAPDQCHSPLWKIRWLFTSQLIGDAFERWAGYRSQVW